MVEAEAALLAIARRDRLYDPAWTLANFYFRRGKADAFWEWAARAGGLTSDARALVRLADAQTADPAELVARLGDRPAILRPYLDILFIRARNEDAQRVARLLRAHGDPADLPRFAALEARLGRIRSEAAR